MAGTAFEASEFVGERFVELGVAGGQFAGKEFENCQFHNCDFSAATLSKCSFLDCRFIGCNLSLLRVPTCRWREVEFEDCKALGIDWTRAAWPRLLLAAPIRFRRCLVSESSFMGLSLVEFVLSECRARGADFRDANLSSADLSYTDFAEALFGKTNLGGANFSEALNYDIDVFDNNIAKAKFTRSEAVRLLGSLDIELLD